ncbi:uncharacterized protein Dana_GF18407 [Drosophila ananassae]|uniref:Bromo domain-containing protein n=1 Tax=Drosophila ananassae TaxID=7217 RepID=B3M1H8_DROAN|nr:bromodomain-containing protein 8 [Drosophila ananassae]EDV43269.1 uncharacterized protein Dana_GF18407 [Drosophila ananassae]
MSAGVQERLQLSRIPLDTWSKREQLCLASAVSCSGDQNWITVSRTLKSVCGNGNGNGSNNNGRPADWYSQKNCALQYGHLLESVEATKRKKRSSESSAGVSSPATVETPTELLLRRLTEERMAEIKAQMRADQETYRRIQREIDSLQSDAVTEQELQDMWMEIEKEQEAERIEEMKLENRLREREQRKKEMAGNWRNSSPAARRSLQPTDTTSVDMDVEDIASSTAKQQSGPSPLLTSLLKSPTGNAPAIPGTGTAGGAAIAGTGSVARATAPTITSLLTSGAGSAAVANQPVITMKSPTDAAFISRPITGPASEALAPTTPTLEKSPSQAAPTLSMLLEKNKAAAKAGEGKSEATGNLEQSLPQEASEAAVSADSDEADPNELLEVFPNIDEIIDDIDIDMASVIDDEILKEVEGVVVSPAGDKSENIDFEDKLDALKREQSTDVPTGVAPKSVELVVGSSDDSNDNIPLATVASQEGKDRSQSGGESTVLPVDIEAENLVSEVAVEEIGETITLISTSSEDTAGSPITKVEEEPVTEPVPKQDNKEDEKEQEAVPEKSSEASESAKEPELKEEPASGEPESKASKEEPEKTQKVEEKIATPAAAPAPASLHDTDEESSSLTDGSKQDDQPRSSKGKAHASKPAPDDSKNEAEHGGTPQPPFAPARAPLLRKLPHRDRSESPMVDDDATTASDHSTARSTRRRCSSTPVIDSIPNSPASSEHTDDRRETRAASKKLFLSIYSTLLDSKNAAPFKRPFHDEHAQRHVDLCLRPMDLPTIKRNIDSGFIRSLSELHRDVLLMAQNVLVAYKPHTNQHKTARLFVQDCQAIKEFSQQQQQQQDIPVASAPIATTPANSGSSKAEREKPSGNKARSGFRKSQRHH